jgi:hypothetical protein
LEAEQTRARTALWNAVQGNGIQVLDNAAVLGCVLADQLSDAPAERHVLVAAAEAGTASALRRHILEEHMDPTAAVRAAATELAARTGIADDRCVWAAAEFSQAMGYPVSVMPGPEEQPRPPSAWVPQQPGPYQTPPPAQYGVQPHTPPPSQYPISPPNQPGTPPPHPTTGSPSAPAATPPPGTALPPGSTPPPGSALPPGSAPSLGSVPPLGSVARPDSATGPGQVAWGQPGSPPPTRSRERRGLLIGGALGGVAVLILAGYLGIAGAAKLPPFASSSAKHRPTPTLTATPSRTVLPSQGPAPLPSGLKPLAQLLPNDVTYPAGCNDGSTKMAPYYPGLVSELSCDASDNTHIAVYAFQFDNTGDYTNGFTTYNNANGFTAASATGTCPPTGSGQGDTSWNSKSNQDFASSAGQELECWQPSNQHPTYLYTMQHFNTFIVATDTLSWSDLDAWWKAHGTR